MAHNIFAQSKKASAPTRVFLFTLFSFKRTENILDQQHRGRKKVRKCGTHFFRKKKYFFKINFKELSIIFFLYEKSSF